MSGRVITQLKGSETANTFHLCRGNSGGSRGACTMYVKADAQYESLCTRRLEAFPTAKEVLDNSADHRDVTQSYLLPRGIFGFCIVADPTNSDIFKHRSARNTGRAMSLRA